MGMVENKKDDDSTLNSRLLENTSPQQQEDEVVNNGNEGSYELHSCLQGSQNNSSECDHVNRPMVHVGDVLREAEDIMSERGAPRIQPSSGEEVLVDEVDVQYSPRHTARPIEIVVRHNTVVSQTIGEKTSSAGNTAFSSCQPSYRFRMIAEGEECSTRDVAHEEYVQDDNLQVQKFKKGHRRAFSMPNTNGNRMTLAVIDKDEVMADGLHKRHIVRYRLHPHKRRTAGGETPMTSDDPLMGIALLDLSPSHDDDNELAIEINEEEIVCSSGISDKPGPRTVVKKFWEARWKVTNFEFLPEWLQDNEYLRTGHRPPLPSFGSCFKSIFSLHTETGNIWTHMYGCVAFIGLAAWFLSRPFSLVQWQEKVIFSSFFIGAVACLGMSFAFHTVQCHSAGVGRLFSRLDYTGISLLIVGSFIPWIYYGFYCRPQPTIVYISMICVLGVSAVIVSLWDKFAKPGYRPLRAGVFVAMGLSSVVPAFHFFITDGLRTMFEEASLHWLLLMGTMYLGGAALYASRIPERCFPGKCDLWFQSHQLFHMFVVSAAFVHFHGITEMAMKRLEQGSCAEQLLDRYGVEIPSSPVDGFVAH